jgi:hypothetical protein
VDACANTLTTSIPFDVIDCKAPAPICINGLAIELMAGSSTISASEAPR